ncbi:MAG: integrase [Agrobacterium sp.]|uniref:integrase n=1 Tax=Agrobacterium sp. TaxID=361 RepID=UPI00403776DC
MTQEGLWRHLDKGTIIVPNDIQLREHILHEMHDAKYAGHVGITKTLERVRRVFWWKTMRADVRHYVTNCDACQRNKASRQVPGGLLNPLSIPGYRWESVTMDLVVKLPVGVHGYDSICVVVDRLSKMVHLIPCIEAMDAKEFAELYIDHVFKYHGLSKVTISDRGATFNNQFWIEVRKLIGVDPASSTAYHPQSDGQTERTNQIVEEMLRHYILPTQVDWPRHLAFAEFAINNSWQESIQSTPFLVNYGQSPITPMLHKLPRPCLSPSAESFAKKWEHEVKHAQECMRVAQDRRGGM